VNADRLRHQRTSQNKREMIGINAADELRIRLLDHSRQLRPHEKSSRRKHEVKPT
jgi:hypothetical protein